MIINTTTNTFNNVGLYIAKFFQHKIGYRGATGTLHFKGQAERSSHPRTAFLYFADENEVDEMIERLKVLRAEMRLSAIAFKASQK